MNKMQRTEFLLFRLSRYICFLYFLCSLSFLFRRNLGVFVFRTCLRFGYFLRSFPVHAVHNNGPLSRGNRHCAFREGKTAYEIILAHFQESDVRIHCEIV